MPRLHSIIWVVTAGLAQKPTVKCVELFAGVARIKGSFNGHGLPAVALDISQRPRKENLLTCAGWLNAVAAVLRLEPGGLFWCGTPCSTWAACLALRRVCLQHMSCMLGEMRHGLR